MNVCFFHGGFSLHGGIGRVVSIIANGLVENTDNEIYSLSLYKDNKPSAYEIRHEIHEDFLYNNPTTMSKAILTNGILRLCRYLKANDISVIIACGALYYPLTVISAKLCNKRSICWEHTNPDFNGDYRFQNIGRSFGARCSYCNVLVSEEAKENYDRRFPRKKNVLIWNPASQELFRNPQKYDLDTNKIISVGRLSYPKNFMRLLKIANDLKRKNKEWHWDIYGEGEEREKLEKEITRLELTEYVTLKGAVNDIYSRYHSYMAIVMTSRYEGFPMALIEGAANGLPMIAFDIKTGPKEIIKSGENGFLINKEDDESMVNAINALLQDKKLRLKMSESAQKSAQAFRMENILPLWEDLMRF